MLAKSLTLLVVLSPFASSLVAQTVLKSFRIPGRIIRPVDVQSPSGDRRVFVVEQAGKVLVVKDNAILPTPFLDITPRVLNSGEQGLLSIAFHPDYATNGHFFVHYTTRTPAGSTTVERYTVSSTDPDVANPSSRKIVLGPVTVTGRTGNHNAGAIRFGNDGFLYVGIGDGELHCQSQDGQSFLGKILRIDINTTTAPYKIPLSNPFVGNSSFRDEIWAYGLRNPWRFSFDRKTGDLWISDVGDATQEEINFQPAGSSGGENYGWPVMEGSHCFNGRGCTPFPPCNSPLFKAPVYTYTRTGGQSVTGGVVYRGCAIPDLRGAYIFGDYVTRDTWSFRLVNGNVTGFRSHMVELGALNSVSFGEDGCGEIYIARYGSWGGLYKIVPNEPPPAANLGFGKVGGNGKVPTFDACGLLKAGSSAEFRLVNAPASSQSLLMVSLTSNPTQLFGGTVATLPALVSTVIPTNSDGLVSFVAPGGGGPASIFAQFLVLDPGASFGLGISNALRVDLQQ